MRLLIFIDHYLPGHRAGGPIRSISNMVAALPAGFDCHVVTRDRDLGDTKAFAEVEVGRWNEVGRAKVLYLSGEDLTVRGLARIVSTVAPDVLYANGLFSRMSLRLLLARRLRWLRNVPFVLAPRGELSPGALAIKPLKKRLFLLVARWSGLLSGIVWQASADLERREIQAALGEVARVEVARNIVAAELQGDAVSLGARGGHPAKHAGKVRFVFVSRISPKKNLDFAIGILGRLSGDIAFDVFGPAEDAEYWGRCETAIGALPSNVKVSYGGAVEGDRVREVFSGGHFFVFPTLGENFGHVIYESLAARCPVVLSDTTPWAQLEKEGAGWVIPLGDVAGWTKTLQRCVDMGPEEYLAMADRTVDVARSFADGEQAVLQTAGMFERAAGLSTTSR